MRTLTVKYNRKDFFGNEAYTEDTRTDFNKNDLVRAFLYLSKNPETVIQIDNLLILWRNAADYEKKYISVCIDSDKGLASGQIPFARIKKALYSKFRQGACVLAE